ncbi:MAG TPA: HAD-IA family hydrolase [Gaiellaceae bacterium]|jgi:pyrophosphatase PpaX|nr:HAD-IA family hydrolase [Gaiellaceae bacterium]
MRFRTVLFDLDGTLIDSGEMILASFRHATRTVLAREIPDEELVAATGGATIYEQMRAFDRDRVEELVRAYREHNEPLHNALAAFDGVEELLVRLVREGRRLGIVTSKRRRTVDLAFRVLPIGEFFETIVTADQVERHKPDPEPVLVALERLGASPGDAAFVGDSPFDVAAGKAAGVFTVAVSWGGIHPEERLLAAGADVIAHSPSELVDVL